jgi:hypothetical protein
MGITNPRGVVGRYIDYHSTCSAAVEEANLKQSLEALRLLGSYMHLNYARNSRFQVYPGR